MSLGGTSLEESALLVAHPPFCLAWPPRLLKDGGLRHYKLAELLVLDCFAKDEKHSRYLAAEYGVVPLLFFCLFILHPRSQSLLVPCVAHTRAAGFPPEEPQLKRVSSLLLCTGTLFFSFWELSLFSAPFSSYLTWRLLRFYAKNIKEMSHFNSHMSHQDTMARRQRSPSPYSVLRAQSLSAILPFSRLLPSSTFASAKTSKVYPSARHPDQIRGDQHLRSSR